MVWYDMVWYGMVSKTKTSVWERESTGYNTRAEGALPPGVIAVMLFNVQDFSKNK